MSILISLVVSAVALAVFFLLLYVVVRAASISAMRSALNLGHTNQLLAAQADLTARLAKHLIAQTDLMVATARHDGLTDEQLAPILAQVAERKADPAFTMPFS
ncbi:MAG: hypothetical protein ABI867_05660 [Kofleriaceae bacterium]